MPLPILTAAPVKGTIGLVTAVGTGLIEANVVAPVGPKPVAAGAPPFGATVGDITTGAGLPGTSPTLGALVAPTGELPVEKYACGTVTAVLSTEVVDEDGIGWPDEAPVEYVICTVTVFEIEMVVAGAYPCGEGVEPTGPAVTPLSEAGVAGELV